MLTRCMTLIVIALLAVVQTHGAFGAEAKVAVVVASSGEAFIIDATVDVPVAPRTAWDVMTDFEHMANFVGNLKSSQVIAANGNTLIVRQDGVAHFGLLSFAFASEREIRLEPMARIAARQVSGTAKSMASEAKIIPTTEGVKIKYYAETVIDSALARAFGASFLRHEVEEQFLGMGREMLRRQAGSEPPHNGRE
jgi:ribosome-associated toxin RatA of RatAB toxin-antitoxin module